MIRALFLSLVFAALPVAAEEEAAPAGEAEHEEKHAQFHFGVTGAVLAAISSDETELHAGGGVFFTWVAIHEWLEIEAVVRMVSAKDAGAQLPIDLLFKKPFHVTHWFHPFIGIGLTIVPEFRQGEHAHAAFGGASALGADFWLSHHVAIVVEANYNLIYRPRFGDVESGIENEIGGAAGVLFAF